jgi:hypothetical protein
MSTGALYVELATKITDDIWESIQRPRKDWTGTQCCACDYENLGDFENAFHSIVVRGEDTRDVLIHGALEPLIEVVDDDDADVDRQPLFVPITRDKQEKKKKKPVKRTISEDAGNNDDDDTNGSPGPSVSAPKKIKKPRSRQPSLLSAMITLAKKNPGPFKWQPLLRDPLNYMEADRMAQLVAMVKCLSPDWKTWMSEKYLEKLGVTDPNECLTNRGGGQARAHPKRPLLKILKVQVGMHSEAFITWSERLAAMLTVEWTDRILYTAIESPWVWNDQNEVR